MVEWICGSNKKSFGGGEGELKVREKKVEFGGEKMGDLNVLFCECVVISLSWSSPLFVK